MGSCVVLQLGAHTQALLSPVEKHADLSNHLGQVCCLSLPVRTNDGEAAPSSCYAAHLWNKPPEPPEPAASPLLQIKAESFSVC